MSIKDPKKSTVNASLKKQSVVGRISGLNVE